MLRGLTLGTQTARLNDAYKASYLELFDRRAKAYESAIEEIQNRPEWVPIATASKEVAETLLTPLRSRAGLQEDRDQVQAGTSLGASSLTEMESDLAAIDGLKSSVLSKLQELAFSGDEKKMIRRIKIKDYFNQPIENVNDLKTSFNLIRKLRAEMRKTIKEEGGTIILE